ncbi:hypothetical protein N431DRAFT_535069 [Stipitochalara longipes BDJ]|nr:hypothetical protein N431DRAFT_535069 [Stipitochalara longipes BDJ]
MVTSESLAHRPTKHQITSTAKMHRLTMALLLAFFLPFTMVLSATDQSLDSLLALGPTDENTVPATFIGAYGNHEYTLNGTVQEVMAQLKELHPEVVLEKREVIGRAALNKILPPLCVPVGNWGWQSTLTGYITDGVTYLNRIGGRLSISAHSCSRISCSYNSAIYLCNDNPGTIDPATVYIASYAQDLINLCSFEDLSPWGDASYTGGQEFDTDKYNVIVRLDSC